MKVHPSCLQDLHSPFVNRGAADYDYDVYTTPLNHNKRSKRATSRRLSTATFVSLGLTAKPHHAIESISATTLFPFHTSHSFAKPNLSITGIRTSCSCSCSPSDADYADAKLPHTSDENVDLVYLLDEDDGYRIQIAKLGKRSRRIEACILIKAALSTVWEVLTDYESLADFIPGLAVSRLLDKRDNYARLLQIGQQDLALGLKFNAKAILDCYEKDLEILSFGERRDIEFKMVEGDFETFEGRWSIVQYGAEMPKAIVEGQKFQTTLFYEVKLEPKLWLPVRLVEGRISTEIKTNMSCIRLKAENNLSSSTS